MFDINILKNIKIVKKIKSDGIIAGVLIPFYKKDNWEIYFIKRIDDGSIHSAQVAFPGGKKEPQDKNVKFTAIRETCEEIGIDHKNIEIVSQIEPTVTFSSNFIVYPFVGILKNNNFCINKSEVDYVFSVPLDFLINKYPLKLQQFEYKGRIFTTYLIEYKSEIIWGATARILNNLLNHILRGG
ncbi:NUDIX hydrolase [Desulfurella sp.]|uniref:NUDIX hydrolase n=1 Tax=Desulfurella sp. TaxID=1962857 RepID=UPI003D0C4C2E